MLVYRLSNSVYRKTKSDDKPTILNPFITSITVCRERRRQTGFDTRQTNIKQPPS